MKRNTERVISQLDRIGMVAKAWDSGMLSKESFAEILSEGVSRLAAAAKTSIYLAESEA